MTAPEKSDIIQLRDEIAKVRRHKFFRSHNTFAGMLGYNFARGLAFGLGSAVGATFLLSVIVYVLSQVNYIPIIGEWAGLIMREIQSLNAGGQ